MIRGWMDGYGYTVGEEKDFSARWIRIYLDLFDLFQKKKKKKKKEKRKRKRKRKKRNLFIVHTPFHLSLPPPLPPSRSGPFALKGPK